MLVLRRLVGRKIYIDGGRITLELLDVQGNSAKIGITAPRSVLIQRDDAPFQGPIRCCRCGGLLPPPGPDGQRVTLSTACHGEPDSESGRCRAFLASTLWGDVAIDSLPGEANG